MFLTWWRPILPMTFTSNALLSVAELCFQLGYPIPIDVIYKMVAEGYDPSAMDNDNSDDELDGEED